MTTATLERRTASVNGAQLSYQIGGAGQPLCLLHGFTGSGLDWRHLFDLEDLARRYLLIVPDLRGHGQSSNPLPTFTHGQCALDVAALLDQLGVGPIRAIGASLGGNVLLHLATRQPDRVEAMVIVSATMYYPAQARAIMREAPVDVGDDQARTLGRHARGFADDYTDMSFTPPHLATITARTLIVYGDRDQLYPVEMGLELYRAIPRASLWVVPGGGHGPIFAPQEREPFARAALGFLDGA
jgi:pimeloyl-ACP methyl ester carboxylesterase